MTDGELLFYHLHKKLKGALAMVFNALVQRFDYCDHIRLIRKMLCRTLALSCSSNNTIAGY